MRYLAGFITILWFLLIVACASTGATNNSSDDGARPTGTFEGNNELKPFGSGKGVTVIEKDQPSPEEEMRFDQYLEVMAFRGAQMPKLLAHFAGNERADWEAVRRRVHPTPKRPAKWPPAGDTLNAEQKTYRAWLFWPRLVRQRLAASDWDSVKSREWLVRQGRLYELIYRFETENPRQSKSAELDRWRQFAESMLAHGDDGRDVLMSCMIVRLGHDNEDIVLNAQSVLVQVGEPAIQPLLDVLWVFQAGNLNFNKQAVATLANMGRAVVGAAIIELREAPRGGTTWRSRRFFVELLGQMTDVRGVRAIVEEIEKTDITEYSADENGKSAPDAKATANAIFVFHEYCINALGKIEYGGSEAGKKAAGEALATIVGLWEKDPDHVDGAGEAIFQITRKRVETLEEAKLLADKYK
ncbi:MAG: hypothetical protein IT462_12790 [Planctomycetes bacterium]|nr:hypothetical protein [Planctomycetota bacterium]